MIKFRFEDLEIWKIAIDKLDVSCRKITNFQKAIKG